MTPFHVPTGLDHPYLRTHDLMRDRQGHALSPFLVISYFDMTGPVFPPHPHAGFSVATYILPDSPTGFWNQDTLGNRNEIAPGSLHWSVAGSGLMHEETVMRAGRLARGFQIWIDHPEELREIAPAALHLAGPDMPVTHAAGVTRRLVVGRDGSATAPMTTPVSVTILDITATAAATWVEDLPTDQQGWLWLLAGGVTVDGVAMAAGQAMALSGPARITAGAQGTRLMRFSGVPTRGPVVQGGPFVGSSAAQIAAFQDRYRQGGMGRLVAFDQSALDRAFDAAQQNIA